MYTKFHQDSIKTETVVCFAINGHTDTQIYGQGLIHFTVYDESEYIYNLASLLTKINVPTKRVETGRRIAYCQTSPT